MLGRKQLVTFTFAMLVAAAVMSPALGADRSDVFTRAVARHGAAAPVPLSTSSAAGFHWLDAGIGAAVGVVACLALVFAAARFLRPSRSVTA